MNNSIVDRRRQIFNTIQAHNNVAEPDISTHERENSASNTESLFTAGSPDNIGVVEVSSGASGENVSDNTIILNGEDGSEIHFEFLDLITYRKKEYVVLLPIDDDADQVVILQVESIGPDEESYISVDNEYTLETVFSLFKERHQHEFDFVD